MLRSFGLPDQSVLGSSGPLAISGSGPSCLHCRGAASLDMSAGSKGLCRPSGSGITFAERPIHRTSAASSSQRSPYADVNS